MSTQSILVTGATGFIGSHLLPALHQTGTPITLAVRDSSQFHTDLNLQTIQISDIHTTTNWQPALQNIHTVIHLAARAHQLHDTAPDPEQAFWSVNTAGTANLVKQSIAAGVQHFIFISSIGAMATLSDQVLTETSPCHPDTPYGRSKLAAEQALIELAHTSPMTYTILRPTLVYGPGNPGNMERLLNLIKTGFPLPFGAIHNRRSFLYVGNLIDIILTTLTHPNAKNQTFLCSDGQDLSTPALIQLIAQSSHYPCRLIPVPSPLLRLVGKLGDTAQHVSNRTLSINTETVDRLIGSLAVDISKLRHQIDWQPRYSVEAGFKTLFD